MIKQILKDLIPPILVKALKPKKVADVEIEYNIGENVITLPPGHTLPKYQKRHKLFDRFLPVLAKYVDQDKVIVDIGANVGDTAIMMHQTSKSPIICVEPSDKFYPYLEKNIARLNEQKQALFTCVKSLIGTSEIKGQLTHYDGTAKVVEAEKDTGSTFVSLDKVLGNVNVGFIKVDTDGYDYDVLNSGTETLRNKKPIVFWENQMENKKQAAGYDKLYENLINSGYSEIYVFDNFGNLMLEQTDFGVVKNLNDYILSMEESGCTRTMYFTDVLACSAKDGDLLRKAIQDYKLNWINK